jgi:hypothetical protein
VAAETRGGTRHPGILVADTLRDRTDVLPELVVETCG